MAVTNPQVNIPTLQPRLAAISGQGLVPQINLGRGVQTAEAIRNIGKQRDIDKFLQSEEGVLAAQGGVGAEAALLQLSLMPGGMEVAEKLRTIADTKEKTIISAAQKKIQDSGQFAGSIRNADLAFKRFELNKKAQQQMKDGFRDEAIETMRISQLATEEEIDNELDQDIAMAIPAEKFLVGLSKSGQQRAKPVGTPSRVTKQVEENGKIVDKNFFIGTQQLGDGSFAPYEVEVGGDFVDIQGMTAQQAADLKLKLDTAIAENKTKIELGSAADIKKKQAEGTRADKIEGEIKARATGARRQRKRLMDAKEALALVQSGQIARANALFGKFVPLNDVTDVQVAESLLTGFVLDTLNKQSGTKTDFDFQKAAEASPELGKTTEANKILLDLMLEDIDLAIAEEEAFFDHIDGGGDATRFRFQSEEVTTEVVDGDAQTTVTIQAESADDLSEEELEEIIRNSQQAEETE